MARESGKVAIIRLVDGHYLIESSFRKKVQAPPIKFVKEKIGSNTKVYRKIIHDAHLPIDFPYEDDLPTGKEEWLEEQDDYLEAYRDRMAESEDDGWFEPL